MPNSTLDPNGELSRVKTTVNDWLNDLFLNKFRQVQSEYVPTQSQFEKGTALIRDPNYAELRATPLQQLQVARENFGAEHPTQNLELGAAGYIDKSPVLAMGDLIGDPAKFGPLMQKAKELLKSWNQTGVKATLNDALEYVKNVEARNARTTGKFKDIAASGPDVGGEVPWLGGVDEKLWMEKVPAALSDAEKSKLAAGLAKEEGSLGGYAGEYENIDQIEKMTQASAYDALTTSPTGRLPSIHDPVVADLMQEWGRQGMSRRQAEEQLRNLGYDPAQFSDVITMNLEGGGKLEAGAVDEIARFKAAKKGSATKDIYRPEMMPGTGESVPSIHDPAIQDLMSWWKKHGTSQAEAEKQLSHLGFDPSHYEDLMTAEERLSKLKPTVTPTNVTGVKSSFIDKVKGAVQDFIDTNNLIKKWGGQNSALGWDIGYNYHRELVRAYKDNPNLTPFEIKEMQDKIIAHWKNIGERYPEIQGDITEANVKNTLKDFTDLFHKYKSSYLPNKK